MFRRWSMPRIGPQRDVVATWFRIAIWVLTASISIWIFLSRESFVASIVAGVLFVPSLALAAAFFPDRFRLESRLPVTDVNRIQLVGPLFFVSFALLFRAFVHEDVVVGKNLVLYGVTGGACVGLFVWAAIRRAGLGSAMGIGMVFCFATVVHVNGLALSKAYIAERGVISKKFVARRGGNILAVRNAQGETRVSVGSRTYDAFELNLEACVFRRVGLMGVEVRYLGACDAAD
jgi:hypothetical protein